MRLRSLAVVCSLLALPSLAKEVVWDAAASPIVGKEVRISDGDVFVIHGTNANMRIEAPIVGPKGTVRGGLGTPGSITHKAVLASPMDVGTILWGYDWGESPLEITAAGNRWKRFELAYARVFCKAANVLAPEGVLTWGSYYRGDSDRCATFDLGGFDQTVDRLESTSSPKGKDADHVISSGGTLTLRGTADATCLARIDGGLSLVWAPKGDFRQTFDERENGMSGKLTVRRGTFCIGPQGAFRRVQEIEVADGAVFECQSALKQALASVRTILLGKNARLKVSGANPFMPGVTTVICRPGAKVESSVSLTLRDQVDADATPPRQIGDKLQVFWDDLIVNRAETTASRVPHHPEFAGTVIKCDKPWEGNAGVYASVIKVGDTWRMYRQGTGHPSLKPFYPGLSICLFESKDGIAWERAKINRYPTCGEKENNVLLDADANFWDNFMVLEDTNPACPPSERFKAIAVFNHAWSEEYAKKYPDYDRVAKGGYALWCFVSADGVDFKPGWKLFNFGEYDLKFDSLNAAFWDPVKKLYRMYMRSSSHFRPNRFGETCGRWVKLSESKDFKTWSEPVEISFADESEDNQLYTNGVLLYPRNPELIVGFPTRYIERKEWTDNYDKLCDAELRRARCGVDPRYGLAITDCLFMWSHDGHVFHREEDAFITPGPEHLKNWNYGNCYPQHGFVVTRGRRGDDPELSFYVAVGCWSASFVELDRYVLRMDGFVSYHGRYRTEKLVTKRVVFSGDELLVNFATSPGGHMFVTVRDEEGRSVRSCELFGDKVDRPVGFDGSLSSFAGKPVTLEFELSDADIYSFRFRKVSAPVLRPIDAPALAERARAYERDLEAAGVSNVTDAVRIPWLGALSMRYRAAGGKACLADAQRLFAVQNDEKRPHAEALTDGPLFIDWMHVADSHFAIAKDPWAVRSMYSRTRSANPLPACYRWKYQRGNRAEGEAALAKLPPDERPDDTTRLADRRAWLGVGAKTVKDVAAALEAKQPSDAEAKARWLWAYWTARFADK